MHGRERLPLVEVIKEILEKYKNDRERKFFNEYGSSITNSATPNSCNSVIETFDNILGKLEIITKELKTTKSLTTLASLFADLEFFLASEAFTIQKKISAPDRVVNWLTNSIPGASYFISTQESAHVDTLLSARSYLNYFHTHAWFPELKIEVDKRIARLNAAYEINAKKITKKPNTNNETTSNNSSENLPKETSPTNKLSEYEIDQLKKANDQIIIDLACYGNISKLTMNDKHKCEELFPGFKPPKASGRNELSALHTYDFSHTVFLAVQDRFFEYDNLVQSFPKAEEIYLQRYCRTSSFTPEELLQKSYLVPEVKLEPTKSIEQPELTRAKSIEKTEIVNKVNHNNSSELTDTLEEIILGNDESTHQEDAADTFENDVNTHDKPENDLTATVKNNENESEIKTELPEIAKPISNFGTGSPATFTNQSGKKNKNKNKHGHGEHQGSSHNFR